MRALRSLVGPDVLLTAVVKANAYGHGAVAVAKQALASGADWLAVAAVGEGLALRNAGLKSRILVVGPMAAGQAAAVVASGLTPTVNTLPVVRALSAAAQSAGKSVAVHLKVDTGMGRYGLLPEDMPAFALAVSALPGLVVEGLWTHFASAEDDEVYTQTQLATLLETHRALAVAGLTIPIRHCANSAGAILHPESRLDMVRCGGSLYGLYSAEASRPVVDLWPVMAIKSTVCRLHWLAAGGTVSYGRTFTASRATKVAFMPIGYADGLRRSRAHKASVLVRGQRAPLIGRICMDGCMADVTDIGEAAEGDEVVFLGRQGEAAITIEEWADQMETISYEVATGIGPRVPRVTVQGGVPLA